VIYEVAQGKQTMRVELREVGENLYDITIGDETARVDACKSGSTVYSMIEGGKQFEAMVDERGEHGFDVTVAGRLFHLKAEDERTKLLTGGTGSGASGPQTIEAEMPGKVVKLNVAAGAEVSEGESVLVIEAMKMENEIRSPIDGVVKEIGVAEGDTVETGVTLFVVEPPPEED
jgi:biotin carboxyl carrier protein